MEIFLDCADIEFLSKHTPTGLIDGVTTNPTIIAKTGSSFFKTIQDICKIVSGPVSAEVIASDCKTMIEQGSRLATLAENVVVKLPITLEGLAATRVLTDLGLKTNLTLCFSTSQAIMAAKAGATYVSPFVGRLEDTGENGIDLIRQIRATFDRQNMKTRILAASLRNASHVSQVAEAGAHAATLPPKVFLETVRHPLTDKGLEIFANDWNRAGIGFS